MNLPLLLMTLLGAATGAILATALPLRLSIAPTRSAPLPHQIPKYPGGISLRFAMVHDVIHERFPKHGPDYYRARNHAARGQLTALEKSPATTRPANPQAWPLMDDIAVGHVHLGEFDPAIKLMRDKLALQQSANITGPDLYPTYANLGTALMIDALVKMQAGKDAADELRESLTWVRKSIDVNPQAHFGREVWQVVLGEFLLDTLRDPSLLRKYDMIGNQLSGHDFDDGDAYRFSPGRPTISRYPNAAELRRSLERAPEDRATRELLRKTIAHVGARGDWAKETHTSHTHPVPFDEPTLAIIGMWRYGGGANPHFALALAEIMTRVGQLHIAWSAYERTARLAGSGALADHCRARQAQLADAMSPADRAELLPAFEADLKAGLDYQAAYQKFESDRLAAGASIDDPHFYDAFLAKHGDIASDPGHADEVSYRPRSDPHDLLPPALFGAGLFALVTALSQRAKRRRPLVYQTSPI